ncbi:hypothetical protein N7493_000438 [Penicillium malachiteum]|uniref:Very-long-chain (3R)-3-hydroxyacyl-CoA dehydratase n=1 Tax=Penicillium malachiteum TaxID=1324776 RepID=A0AAD6HWB4_9EURO|nr:hypothetical protein N7493_000438 [Penicillium malachiteum]
MPPKESPPQSSISRTYLLLYNTTCAALWLHILISTIRTLISSPDISTVYQTVEPWVRYTQTLAIVEILHAAIKLTRSPVFTTFTQVYARSVQVWAINYAFAATTAPSPAYPAMILAWSLADTIRYLYFAIMQARYPVPGILKWARYSLFLVLYPIGIGSEWWLMYQATTATTNWAVLALYYFFLGLYVPGSIMMYSYMLKQRRKVLTSSTQAPKKDC